MSAFKDLCETEGIIPAIESSHAVAGAYKAAEDLKAKGYEHPVMIINISGRGDKDMNTAGKWFGYLTDEQAKALEANGARAITRTASERRSIHYDERNSNHAVRAASRHQP